MKTGILTSGVSQNLDHALQCIHADGFRHVEIQFAWGVEDGDYSTAQETEICRLLKQYHMRCTAVMKNLFSGMTLDDTQIASSRYRDSLRLFRNTIRLARALGCHLTRVNSFDKHNVIFGFGGAEHYLSGGNRAWNKYLKLMEPVCRIAEDEDIDIMVETGTGGFLCTAALAKKACDDLHSAHFRVLWDPANCIYNGEIPLPRAYEQLREHIAEIHIKDLRFRRELAEATYCPLGQGSMAPYLKPLAALLRQDSFSGVVVLENQVTPSGGTEEDGYRLSVPVFKKIFCEAESN